MNSQYEENAKVVADREVDFGVEEPLMRRPVTWKPYHSGECREV
jgi:hypothetical protein